jgi:hypothetical protein
MEDECIARDCFHPVVVVTTLGPLCEVHAKRLCLEPACKHITGDCIPSTPPEGTARHDLDG